jgi:hypothetical protein
MLRRALLAEKQYVPTTICGWAGPLFFGQIEDTAQTKDIFIDASHHAGNYPTFSRCRWNHS